MTDISNFPFPSSLQNTETRYFVLCNLIVSRLAGKVYSFFQRFHGLTISKYYETAKIGGLTKNSHKV